MFYFIYFEKTIQDKLDAIMNADDILVSEYRDVFTDFLRSGDRELFANYILQEQLKFLSKYQNPILNFTKYLSC